MDDDDDNQQQQQQQRVLLQKKASVTTTSASTAARGYVATQHSLNGLIQELLATVKGLRREQKEQKELIEDLTTQLEDQKRLVLRMQRQQGSSFSNNDNNDTSPEPDSNDPSIPPPGEASDDPLAMDNTGNYSSDLAKLRRELVGMIGSAMAQQEEELAAALGGLSGNSIKSRCDCPCCCNNNTTDKNSEKNQSVDSSKEIKKSVSRKDSDAVPLLQQPDLEDFRVNVLPKLLAQRTFHANGASILGRLPSSVTSSTTSYIDCPMKMVAIDTKEAGAKAKEKRRYTWSVEVVQQPGTTSQWAVGIALLSSASKWETSATINNNDDSNDNSGDIPWLLGGKKGEWAYRSDGTLWTNAKQRKNIMEASSKDDVGGGSDSTTTRTASKSKVTLTLEFQPNNKLVLRGSVVRMVPSPPQKVSSSLASVWFEMPWNNFKKPASTAFVPAVTVQDGCLMRFLGWE